MVKTSTGLAYNDKSMNGIISIDDGSGTLITGGQITTDNINAINLNADFITANNLLEADKNETITGEWSFNNKLYIIEPPTGANDAVNLNYADTTYLKITDADTQYLKITDADTEYLKITDAQNDFMDLTTDQAVFGEKIFVDSMANTTIWYSNNIIMFPTYEPTEDYSVATKLYVDAKPTGITEAQADLLYISLYANQGVSGIKTFNNIFMTGVYTPTSAQQVTTKQYVDSLFVGSALPFGAIFGKGVDTDGNPMPTFTNCRLQDPADSPTSLEVGQSNVIIGRRAGQYISGAFSRFNTFVGAESGGQFQKGITNPFGLGNVFIGTHAGDNSQSTEGNANQGYQYNYTVSIGAYSFPSESNSTNLGGIFVRIHGFLRCPLYEAINTPSLNINTSGNGISLENNVRIFFDNLVGTSNHYTANSHFFTGTLYQFIGGLNYEILSANNAWTKSVADTRFVRTGAVNQTIEGIKTFTQFTYYKPGFVSYKLLSELEAYTKTEIDSNFLTITDASNTYFTIANATGFLTNSDFFNGSNTRLQDPNDSPTPFNGFNNTFVGYRSGQHANSNLAGLNTFIGFQAGKHFGDGGLQGGTSNNFIGANSGWDGVNTTPYAYTGTTCIGQFSVATADNQIVLGNSSNNVIVPGNIRAGSLDISGNGNGIFLNNDLRIFFDVVTGSSNHYTATSHFFTGTLYQFIGGLNYEILSANNAWTKSVADNRFLRIGASGDPPVAQTVLGTKTFENILMSSGYVPSVALSVVNKGFSDSIYQLISNIRSSFNISQSTYYSTTYCNNQFQTIANLVAFFISTNTATRYYSAGYSNDTFQTISNIRNSATNTTTTYFSTNFINNTFQTIANMTNYLTTSVASATYQTIADMTNYLTTSVASATYQTIADMSNYITTAYATANYQRLPKQFTQWRYGVQTSSGGTFLFWSSGQYLWTASAGSTAGYTNFKHQTGFNAVGEGTGQLSNSTGYWTAVSEGMYDIQINIQSYPTFNNYIYVSFNDSTGFMGNDIMMKTGLTQSATGATPLAVSNTFHAQVYLKANEGFRIRTVANGYFYSFYNHTYQIITKLTGY